MNACKLFKLFLIAMYVVSCQMVQTEDELVFIGLNSKQNDEDVAKEVNVGGTGSVDLQRVIETLQQVDTWTRDNQRQFNMVHECQSRLASLRNELTAATYSDWLNTVGGAWTASDVASQLTYDKHVNTEQLFNGTAKSTDQMILAVRNSLVQFFK